MKWPITSVESNMVKTILIQYEDHLEKGRVSVTKWINGEGFDVSLDGDNLHECFCMTYSQFDCLKKAIKKLGEPDDIKV